MYRYDPSTYPGHFVDFRPVRWDQPRTDPIDQDEHLAPDELPTSLNQSHHQGHAPTPSRTQKVPTSTGCRSSKSTNLVLKKRCDEWYQSLVEGMSEGRKALPKHPCFRPQEIHWIGDQLSISQANWELQRAWNQKFPSRKRVSVILDYTAGLLSCLTDEHRHCLSKMKTVRGRPHQQPSRVESRDLTTFDPSQLSWMNTAAAHYSADLKIIVASFPQRFPESVVPSEAVGDYVKRSRVRIAQRRKTSTRRSYALSDASGNRSRKRRRQSGSMTDAGTASLECLEESDGPAPKRRCVRWESQ